MTFTITSWVKDGRVGKQIVFVRCDGSAHGPFEYPLEHTVAQVLSDLAVQLDFMTIAPPEIEVTIA